MDNKGTVHADGYRSAEVSTHRRLFHVIISGMEKINETSACESDLF